MDPKTLLLQHFEKALLALAGGWFLYAGVTFFMAPDLPRGTNIEDLEKRVGDIDQYMEEKTPDPEPKPTWLEGLQARLSKAEPAGAFPNWVLHRRPTFFYRLPAAAVLHHPQHYPPINLSSDNSTRGQISLSWSHSDEDNVYVVWRYEVQRKTAGGEWETLDTVEGTETSYTDTSAESRTDYSYQIVSVAEIDRDNPVVRQENMKLPASDERKTSGEAGPTRLAANFVIIPSHVDEVTREELIANAKLKETDEWGSIKVFTWVNGRPFYKTFTVKIGETIGKKKRVRGQKEKIDFSTGATLVDVWTKKTGHSVVHHIKFRYPDGSEGQATSKDKKPE